MGDVVVSQRIATGLLDIEVERVGQVAIQLHVHAVAVMVLLGMVITSEGGGLMPLVIVTVIMRMVIYLLMTLIMQVFVRHSLAEWMILVRHGASCRHPEHQGVIEHKQQGEHEFPVHGGSRWQKRSGTLALWSRRGQTERTLWERACSRLGVSPNFILVGILNREQGLLPQIQTSSQLVFCRFHNITLIEQPFTKPSQLQTTSLLP